MFPVRFPNMLLWEPACMWSGDGHGHGHVELWSEPASREDGSGGDAAFHAASWGRLMALLLVPGTCDCVTSTPDPGGAETHSCAHRPRGRDAGVMAGLAWYRLQAPLPQGGPSLLGPPSGVELHSWEGGSIADVPVGFGWRPCQALCLP